MLFCDIFELRYSNKTLSVSSNLKIHNMERVIGSCSDGAMVEDEVVVVVVQLQL